MKLQNVVNNFEEIGNFLEWNNQNEFYFLQIIQRKKDGNVTDTGNNGYRTIKTYYIYSKEQLEKKKDKIIELCESNNARAYINVNRRNATEVALSCIQQYAKLVSEGNAYQGYRVYDSACGGTRARGYKPNWIVDIDTSSTEIINKYIDIINSCRGTQENKIKTIIPTAHGVHLITTGFDVNQFKQLLMSNNLDNVDIHKDNPTLLYFKMINE